MRRFYENVSTARVAKGPAFGIRLDARDLRTPLRRPLRVPASPLAEAIADEWRAQGGEIDTESMPLTRIACTAVDRVVDDRDACIDRITAYGETDLVCYRAPSPAELPIRQSRAWDPLLEWSRAAFGVDLRVTDALAPVEQGRGAIACLRAAVADHDPYELAALGVAAAASGSAIVALALSHGRLDAGTAFEASQLDESHQIGIWGEEADAQARRRILRAELDCAAAFLELLRAA